MSQETKNVIRDLEIQVVQIHDNKPVFVRHHSPAKAREWLIKDQVTARTATQRDIIGMVESKAPILGPFEDLVAGSDDGQQDLIPPGNDPE